MGVLIIWYKAVTAMILVTLYKQVKLNAEHMSVSLFFHVSFDPNHFPKTVYFRRGETMCCSGYLTHKRHLRTDNNCEAWVYKSIFQMKYFQFKLLICEH